MSSETTVRIIPSEISTSATIIRAHLAAAVAYARRSPDLAHYSIELALEELLGLQEMLTDNPSKG